MAPENRWLEDVFYTEMVPFWGHSLVFGDVSVSYVQLFTALGSLLWIVSPNWAQIFRTLFRTHQPMSTEISFKRPKNILLHTLLECISCILCMLCILCIVFRLCILPSINHQHVYPRSKATSAQVSLSCISTKSHRNVYEIYPPGKNNIPYPTNGKKETHLPNYPWMGYVGFWKGNLYLGPFPFPL